MADNQQTYNPLSDSSIEPDTNQAANNTNNEEDLGSEIASQITGQSYSDSSNQSDDSGSE